MVSVFRRHPRNAGERLKKAKNPWECLEELRRFAVHKEMPRCRRSGEQRIYAGGACIPREMGQPVQKRKKRSDPPKGRAAVES